MSRQYVLDRPKPGFRIDYAAELNEQQLAVVWAESGPALVIAGAGSGKTRTLTYRVAWLLENGVAPWQVLLLTFTNKAAREMTERVRALIPVESGLSWSGTFHSIGNRLLRRHAEEIGFDSSFSIMDREDQSSLLDAVIADAGIDPRDKRFPKGNVLAEIFSLSVNTATPLQEVLFERFDYFSELSDDLERIQRGYEKRKRQANSLDFDDLQIKTLELLREHPQIAQKYQRQFQHILVDEYQDTNAIQGELIELLGKEHRNVMVVGDDAQSIYSWRGANFENILKFPERYAEARVFKIETNYRSVPEVLEVANAAIAANVRQFKKVLHPARPAGTEKPALIQLGDSNQQAQFVAQRILELHDEGVDLNEMAVLYRAHYHSLEVQLELTRRNIPFQITSGLRFFEQAHIKDVGAFLRFVVNPRDELAFLRMARLLPGIGNRSAAKLWSELDQDAASFKKALANCRPPGKAENLWRQLVDTLEEIAPGRQPEPPNAMIHSVVEAIYEDYLKSKYPNYETRREDLRTLEGFAAQFADADSFLAELSLLTSLDTADTVTASRETKCVNLTSIHQAKGLEWRAVFIIWMTDGMFPSSRAMDSDESLEEERRLFYVACTRAKDLLHLTWPTLRLNAGYGESLQKPSRFLQEIPEDLLEKWEISPGW